MLVLFDVLRTLVPLAALVALAVYLKKRQPPGTLPVRVWQAPPPPGLVKVTGQVLGGNPLSPFHTIRYPLPDGTDGELRAAVTRPAMLQAGMLVPVLVDPLRPHEARIDVPAHRAVVNVVKTAWIVIAVLAASAALTALVLGLALRGT